MGTISNVKLGKLFISMVAAVALQAIAKDLIWWLEDYVIWKMSSKASFHSRRGNTVYLVVLVGTGGALM